MASLDSVFDLQQLTSERFHCSSESDDGTVISCAATTVVLELSRE